MSDIEVVDDEMARVLSAKSGAERDLGYIETWAERLGVLDTWHRVRARAEG